MSDRIFGVLIVAISIWMAWGASIVQESFIQDPLGPKVFPWMIAAVMGVSGLVMIIRPDTNIVWPRLGKLIELFATIGVLLAYAQFMPTLGFVLSTAMAASYLSWRLGSTAKESIIAGILLSVGIYLIFHFVLGLNLAKGPWGF